MSNKKEMRPNGSSEGKYAVFLVRSTAHAFHIEKVLMQAGIPCRLIHVPRHLGSDCGVCVRVEMRHKGASMVVLDNAKVAIEAVHEI